MLTLCGSNANGVYMHLLHQQARLRDAETAAELARYTAAQDARTTADATAILEADLQVHFTVICNCSDNYNMHDEELSG
jgi:hypothetical protein